SDGSTFAFLPRPFGAWSSQTVSQVVGLSAQGRETSGLVSLVFRVPGSSMQQVKMLADVVDVARQAEDRWYVTIGHAAVGPVNLDLIARGVEAGKVPLGAFVRHEQWTVWRPL